MSALGDRLRRLPADPAARVPVDERPGCAYGAVTRQSVQDLRDQVNRVEAKVNAILGGVGVAIVVEIVLGVTK